MLSAPLEELQRTEAEVERLRDELRAVTELAAQREEVLLKTYSTKPQSD